MQKFNFSYDKEHDDLFLHRPDSKSKGSVEIGNLILDYNSKKELVGLQIMGASKVLQDLTNETARITVNGIELDTCYAYNTNPLGVSWSIDNCSMHVSYLTPSAGDYTINFQGRKSNLDHQAGFVDPDLRIVGLPYSP